MNRGLNKGTLVEQHCVRELPAPGIGGFSHLANLPRGFAVALETL